MVAQACNASTQEVGTEQAEVQGQPQLYSKFETKPVLYEICLKKQAKVFMSLYVLCESSFLLPFLSERENYTYDCIMENEVYKCVANTEHGEQNKRGERIRVLLKSLS